MYKLSKTTILNSHYATSDEEGSFVFDQCPDYPTHSDNIQADRDFYHWWGSHPSSDIGSCRVYPSSLLPTGHQHQKGSWRITIEFIPSGEED